MAIQAWQAALAAALGGGFFYFTWRVKRAASPDKLLGEVREVRRKWLWALEAGRLLVIRHDTHNTPTVRLQFRKPGAVMMIRLRPAQALGIAALLRQAAVHEAPGAPGVDPTASH